MKHTVALQSTKQLTVDDLTNASHVGFIAEDGSKGYIALMHQVDGVEAYIAIDPTGGRVSVCNHTYGNAYEMLKECVKNLKEWQATVFCFDTRKELYQWLAE